MVLNNFHILPRDNRFNLFKNDISIIRFVSNVFLHELKNFFLLEIEFINNVLISHTPDCIQI